MVHYCICICYVTGYSLSIWQNIKTVKHHWFWTWTWTWRWLDLEAELLNVGLLTEFIQSPFECIDGWFFGASTTVWSKEMESLTILWVEKYFRISSQLQCESSQIISWAFPTDGCQCLLGKEFVCLVLLTAFALFRERQQYCKQCHFRRVDNMSVGWN